MKRENFYDFLIIGDKREKIEKLWKSNNLITCKYSNFDIFSEWVVSREINNVSQKRHYDLDIPYKDHANIFNDVHGNRIITIQPYDIVDSKINEIKNWCYMNDFIVLIYTKSWYYPNQTTLIELYNFKKLKQKFY